MSICITKKLFRFKSYANSILNHTIFFTDYGDKR